MASIWDLIDDDLELASGPEAFEVHEFVYSLVCQSIVDDEETSDDGVVALPGEKAAIAEVTSGLMHVLHASGPTEALATTGHALTTPVAAPLECSKLRTVEQVREDGQSQASHPLNQLSVRSARTEAATEEPSVTDVLTRGESSATHLKKVADVDSAPSAKDKVAALDASAARRDATPSVTHEVTTGTTFQRLKTQAWPLATLTKGWAPVSAISNPGVLEALQEQQAERLLSMLMPDLTSGQLRWCRKRRSFHCRSSDLERLNARLRTVLEL